MHDVATVSQKGSMRGRVEMYNANALKIGLFGANCSSARTATLVPERWSASWPDCLKLARLADDAGVDFLLPIGRWKGYGGDSDFHGTTLETLTWASGLLAATERITVFGTVHAPLFHPLIAAKEMVTADQIGDGRFGLNLVAGWNEGEFQMFGVAQREHEERYAFAQEWIDVIKRAWSEDDFDFDGRYFKLAGVRAKPRIVRSDPVIRHRVVPARVARQVRAMMIGVVRGGTGTAARIAGVEVAGKTGTAELRPTAGGPPDPKNTDAWFVAFAPAGKPLVVVGVMLVGAGAGGAAAAPIARRVLQAALGR